MNLTCAEIDRALDALRFRIEEIGEGEDDDDLVRKLEAAQETEHDWQEQPGEPPRDVCSACGAVRW